MPKTISGIYGKTGYRPVNRQVAESAGFDLTARTTKHMPAPQAGRLWLRVPFAEKDAARRLGARWDPNAKFWWIPAHAATERFMRWIGKRKRR